MIASPPNQPTKRFLFPIITKINDIIHQRNGNGGDGGGGDKEERRGKLNQKFKGKIPNKVF